MGRPCYRASVKEIFEKRIALITGKGGVGRTTISAGMALAAAKRGRRVLLTEIGEPTGDYTGVARIFGLDALPVEPETVAPGVKACVLWARSGHASYLREILPADRLVKAAMNSDALRRLLESAPSFREMGIFYQLLTLLEEKRRDGSPVHELIIVDMPASGHTLGLTGLPERLLSLLPSGPIAETMQRGQQFIYNEKTGGAYVVTLPETLPVTEALELVDGLVEDKVPVAGIIMNRVLRDPFTDEERKALLQALEGRDVFGKVRFLAITEVAEAVARLRAHTQVPIHEVEELPLTGDELLDGIASQLTREP